MSIDINHEGAVDVVELIDERRIDGWVVLIFILCSFAAVLNGADNVAIAVAAPLIAQSLDVTRAHLGPVFAAGLAGAVLGTSILGLLADRIGRKRILIFSTIVAGVFTLATAAAHSLPQLLMARFLTGIGLGGATPCFIALASEYAPRRHRAVIANLVWAGWPVGSNLGSFLYAAVVSAYGWKSIFLVGGLLPLVFGLLMIVMLPESVRFLILRGRDAGQVRRIIDRLQPGLPVDVRIVSTEEKPVKSPLRSLFSEGRTLPTLLLWLLFLSALGTGTVVFSFAITLMRGHGIAVPRAAMALGMGGIGMLPGAALAGRLMQRFGVVAVLVPALVVGAVGTALLGEAAGSVTRMSVDLFICSFCLSGLALSGALTLAANSYPTSMRSTGIGWGMGAGGIGQVMMLLIAGRLLGAGWEGGGTFQLLAIAPLVGAVSVLLLVWQRPTIRAQGIGATTTFMHE